MVGLPVIWIIHIGVMFWSVVFPLHFMTFNLLHRMKYVHALAVCLAIVVPTIAVAAVFGTDGFIPFPPFLCFPKNENAAFYSFILPVSIITPSGISLLLVMFRSIHKVNIKLMHDEFVITVIWCVCNINLPTAIFEHKSNVQLYRPLNA